RRVRRRGAPHHRPLRRRLLGDDRRRHRSGRHPPGGGRRLRGGGDQAAGAALAQARGAAGLSRAGSAGTGLPSGAQPSPGRTSMIEVKAELVGNLWKIVTEVRQSVDEDDTLMILESMKMEIPITSPVAGTVTGILVAEGEVVQEGQTVATIEPT